jgi:hypothetical protein
MRNQNLGFFQAFLHNATARSIDQLRDAQDLLTQSGADYQVRIGRLFLSDSAGERCHQLDTEYLVICDIDGIPISGPSGPLTLRATRSENKSRPRNSYREISSGKIALPEAVKTFESAGFHALDYPKSSKIEFHPINEANSRLASYYECETGSTRATVAFDSDGNPIVVGIVGSRYTVLQNEQVAGDALAFTSSSDSEFEFCASRAIVFGTPSQFTIAMEILEPEHQTENGIQLQQRLVLVHSHDTTIAYNHVWTIEGTIPGSEEPTILGIHKVSIKHTKNIAERAALINETIGTSQEQYKLFVDEMNLLRSIEINQNNDLSSYFELITKNDKKKIEHWLTQRYRKKYLEDIAPILGFNLWSLYLAVAFTDGVYWDLKLSSSGLPSLIDMPESFKTRRNARANWIEFAVKQS